MGLREDALQVLQVAGDKGHCPRQLHVQVGVDALRVAGRRIPVGTLHRVYALVQDDVRHHHDVIHRALPNRLLKQSVFISPNPLYTACVGTLVSFPFQQHIRGCLHNFVSRATERWAQNCRKAIQGAVQEEVRLLVQELLSTRACHLLHQRQEALRLLDHTVHAVAKGILGNG